MNRKANWAIGLLLIVAINVPTVVPIANADAAKSQPTDSNLDPVNPWDCRLRRDCPTGNPWPNPSAKKNADYKYPESGSSSKSRPQGDANEADKQKHPSNLEKKNPSEKFSEKTTK